MKAKIGDQVETPKGRTAKRKGWCITVSEVQLRLDSGDTDISGFTRGGRRVDSVPESQCRPVSP